MGQEVLIIWVWISWVR